VWQCCRSESQSKWTRSSPSGPDLLDPGPAGFAHRGLHGPAAPENSLAAFAAALDIGAGIECDLRLTSDDHIIVFHDADASRLCGTAMQIGRSNLTAVGELRLAGEPIPTLEELLALVGGRVPLLLEIKTDDDVGRWGRALLEKLTAYRGQYGIMSFDPMLVRSLKAHSPEVRRGLVIDAELSSFRRKLALSLAEPQFVAVDRRAAGEAWVQSLRRLMPVYTWTIRTPDERMQAQVQGDALIWEADGRP
jgi:glycerophosphoryl diester phosphodiesterase